MSPEETAARGARTALEALITKWGAAKTERLARALLRLATTAGDGKQKLYLSLHEGKLRSIEVVERRREDAGGER